MPEALEGRGKNQKKHKIFSFFRAKGHYLTLWCVYIDKNSGQ